jgi:ABC-type sugar transport system ATPase subunit
MVDKSRRSAAATPAGEVVLTVEGVAKAFGATQALRTASLELRAGEVHCIVGENGSGKSTLVKILAGVHRPDAGRLELAGRELRLAHPRASLANGICTVFQEVLVVEPRSVLENVWVGVDALLRARVSEPVKRERAAAVLAELLERPPALETPVELLSLSERQACCLARAIVREPKVLILDEATSALDVGTRDRLFGLLGRLAAAGTAVVFISHRMDEIAEIGDRCTVMRSGETVATLERADATAGELVRLMTGAESLAPPAAAEAARAPLGDVALEAKGIVLREGAGAIDFAIRAGELVGLAGLEGHGQDAFIKALWTASGGDGVAYVPRERRAESLFESKSIRENFGLPTLDRDVRRGLLRPGLTRDRLGQWVERLSIKLGSSEDLITTLSGGNQQKVVMARWLATEPRVLLLNDPTRGVDVGAKRDLYRLLTGLAQEGVAVVMLSTEVDEHVELMDRVLVFREQRLATELARGAITREGLVAAFFGRGPGEDGDV